MIKGLPQKYHWLQSQNFLHLTETGPLQVITRDVLSLRESGGKPDAVRTPDLLSLNLS